jgi:hypothetical protein
MGIKYDKKDANPNGFRPDSLFAVTDEKKIFELLGFPYVRPIPCLSKRIQTERQSSWSQSSETTPSGKHSTSKLVRPSPLL